jgi:tetratricopeptide (TPR) repeat protein
MVGADTASAMLLDAAHRQAHRGDYALAVALAEELLDLDPQNVDALLLVADAAPRYGHGEVGVLAARSAAELGGEPGAALAAALYAAGQGPAALAAAEACIGVGRDLPRAHAVRALALELLGRLPEADEALAQAHALRPESYPLPVHVAEDAWDAHLLRGIAGLDLQEQAAIRHWEISFRAAPTPEVLLRASPPLPPSTLSSLSQDDDGLPRLQLYTRNLTRGTGTESAVVDRITEALRDELEWFTRDDS